MSRIVETWSHGMRRGRVETRIIFTSPADVMLLLSSLAFMLALLLFNIGTEVEGSDLTLGSLSLPGVLAAGLVFSSMPMIAGKLAWARMGGELLRAKSLPNGIGGFLIGHIMAVSILSASSTCLMLVIGLSLFEDLVFDTPERWLRFAVVLLAGAVATLPIGAVLGAAFKNPRHVGLLSVPLTLMTAVSGIFYPLSALPVWVQWIGQAFPMYWIGLGMRSALLPESSVAIEIGQSWRTAPMIAAVLVWTVLGIAAAVPLIRRMARREDLSNVSR